MIISPILEIIKMTIKNPRVAGFLLIV